MAITTVQGVIDGMIPPKELMKAAPSTYNSTGWWLSNVYAAGIPAAMAAPSSGLSGAAITSRSGLVSFTNPASGETRIAKLLSRVQAAATACHGMIVDRLWDNSGMSSTSTSSQTINSATLPARDLWGATDGVGVYAAVEVSAAVGAGVPTFTLTYTNSAGTGSRTGTVTVPAASAPAGTWHIFGLQAGDVGIRSIQSFIASATSTSGTFHLVLFRPILHVIGGAALVPNANQRVIVDALSAVVPKLYDNTCLQFVGGIAGNAAPNMSPGQITVSQG